MPLAANLTDTNPAPVVRSHGTFEGLMIGANVLLSATIAFTQLINGLAVIAARFATELANDENTIQSQLGSLEDSLQTEFNIAKVNQDIQKGGSAVTTSDQLDMQEYNTQLGVVQSQISAATKGIDPTLTTTQNVPTSLQQSENEFIQEAGTVTQGISVLANDRIN